MKRFFVLFLILFSLISWIHTEAEAQTDTTKPMVTFPDVPTGRQSSNFTIMITFDETVYGFLGSEIELTPTGLATVSLSGSGTTYTATIAPTAGQEGTLTITVPADVVIDASSNGNTAASTTVEVDKLGPTSTISGAPSGTVNDAFDITVTFSDGVRTFVPTHFGFGGDATGSVTASVADADNKVFTVTITPGSDQDGMMTIQVPSGRVPDTLGNRASASNTVTVDIDTKPPTLTITPPSGTQNEAFDVTFAFSEAVTGFTSGDITLDAGARVSSFTGSNGDTTYTATITPKTTSTVTISVAAEVATDTAGNDNEAASITVGVDLPHAIMVMEPEDGVEPYSEFFTVMIMFTESVDSFTDSDITLSPSGLAMVSVSGSAPTYTATITPADGETGDLDIKVANAAVQDGSSMNYPASNTVTVKVDTKRPTVAIDAPTSDPQNSAFDITIRFSEEVYDFEETDINLGGSASATPSLKSGSDGDDVYTVTITPSRSGNLTIEVDGDAAKDDAGNGSAMSDAASVTIDQDAPTVTISDVPTDPQKNAFTVDIDFNENVENFDMSNITLAGDDVASVTGVNGSGKDYTATITPAGMGSITVQVKASEVQDTAGNDNEASNTVTIAIDSVKPTVMLSGVPTGRQKNNFTITITFSESVTGFVKGDITLAPMGLATVSSLSRSGMTYTATIAPTAGQEGTLTITVPANAAVDDATNENTAASTTVEVDKLGPTSTISGAPSGTVNAAFDITVTFSDSVRSFVPNHFDFGGDATGSVTASVVDADNKVFMVTITPDPDQDGVMTIQVPSGRVPDTLGNRASASNTVTIDVDTSKPTVMFSGVPTTKRNRDFTITITFDETVYGFLDSDITLTPTGLATVSNFTGDEDDTVYTATIAPTTGQEGTLTITVPAGAATDGASNGNEVASTTVEVDRLGPTSTISGAPSGTVNGAFDITVTFSDSVRSFVPNHFDFGGDATGSVTGNVVDADNKVFMVTITPDSDQDGVMTIQVPSGRVPDTLGNRASASNTVTIDVDTKKPTVVISGAPTIEKNVPFDLTVTFSEEVNGFTVPADLAVTGPAIASWKSGVDGDMVYVVTITPSATSQGDVTVQVKANAVKDLALNDNTAASAVTPSVHVDTIVPTVAISGAPVIEQNIPFDLTVTFSEAVNGFAVADDLTLTGNSATASLKAGVAGASVYVVTITPNAITEGDVTVQVNANTVQDLALNDNTAASAVTPSVHVDTIVPTVAISGAPTIEKNVPFDLTVTFDEAVNGFAMSTSLTLTGPATASLKSGTNGASVYTVTITPNPTLEGDVTVQVNAAGVKDFALNDNTASNTPSVHVDTIVPTVAISGAPTIEKNVPFDLTVTFDEAVNGFAVPADLTLTGSSATASLKSGVNGDMVYVVTITPNPTVEGDVTVQVNANTVQDLALNDNTAASAVTPSVHVDTIVPTVAISGAPTIEKNVPFDLTVTFDEAVNGFAVPADLTLTGSSATASLKSGVNGDMVYVVTITPNPTVEGDVTVQVNANTVQDLALNDNTAASAVTPSVHVDTIVPTVAISGAPTIEKNVPFDLTVTFDEAVNGFAVPADLTLNGPATASLKSGVDTDLVYVVTITPNATAEGNVTVQVNAAGVQDFALNDNTASNTPSVHVDTIVPTVAISGVPTIEKNVLFNLTITFLEPVNGFAVPADLTVTGPARARLTAGSTGDREYTVTITPNATSEGDVTVRVNATTVKDFALNDNTASNTPSVHVDTIRPTVRFEDVPVLEKRNDIFDITVVFSEPVNGFQGPADMTIDGPVTASLTSGSDGAAEYTVTITPNPNSKGDLTFQVNANTVKDFALNNNTASDVTDAVRIDTVPPIAEITNLPTVAGAPFDVTITFNEEVTGFASADIALTGPATATLKSGVDGDTIYTATITPNPNAKGDVRILIPTAVVKDLALNDNIPSEITPPVHVDTNALTVQITDVPETVQLEDFSVMIKFSMGVADFVLADITISGDAAIQTSSLSGRGSVYLLKITPEADTDGDVTIQVPAGVATDAASNSNTASVLQTVSVAPKWMPEAGLRDATREVLGLDAGEDFERAELKKLTTLTAESSDIRILTGLEAATNLTALDLSGNAITDIALLRGLTKLTTLDLGANAITDITTLAQLTELTTLDLSGNAITDITLLQGLTKLTTLDLGANAITDIAVLAGLTKLTTLNLSDNPISNLNPLLALTSLTTLGLSGNAINDLTVISDLTGLLVLNLSDNAIADITLLQNLTALTTLDLSGNTVSNLITLAGLTQLRTLNLNNNTVSDLTSLGGLTNLTTLALAGNAISTLNPIATLRQLTLLDLSDNNISDVSTLASLANLTTLRLMGNPILDTTPLHPLTQRLPPVDIDIAVSQYTPWDVNADGSVDAADSALVTVALGQIGDGIVNPRTDVNGDGSVDNADLLLVTENFDNVPGAPAVADILRLLDPATLASLNREVLATELQRLVLESDGSLKYRRAIELLQRLLAVERPDQTRLFANYPNPFNPETWIPYQLAVGSKVELVIYDVKGVVVRHLELGHQPTGYYTQKNRAAYWDGRNAVGERVASGIYFYQLQADNVSLLRKMVILK